MNQPVKQIYGAMSQDGSIARISIEEGKEVLAFLDMPASDLTDVIHALALVRKGMAEKVPHGFGPGERPVFRSVTRDARCIVGREHVTSREVYLALRHEGFGWLAFTFQELPAAEMVLKMSENIATMRPRIVTPPKPGIIT